jgi:hypothetical protein
MSDQITDKVLAAQGHGPWEIHRQPDAVRAAALANAVDLHAGTDAYPPEPDRVLETARTFEAYLTGEEANGS